MTLVITTKCFLWISDRVVFMDDGVVKEISSPEELFKNLKNLKQRVRVISNPKHCTKKHYMTLEQPNNLPFYLFVVPYQAINNNNIKVAIK